MRRLLTGVMVALVTAAIPAMVLAQQPGGCRSDRQHVMKYSGRMSDYQVGVKFQNGTAWLRGRVASEEQMETAIRLAFQVKAVDRVVNELTVEQRQPAARVASELQPAARRASCAPPQRRYRRSIPRRCRRTTRSRHRACPVRTSRIGRRSGPRPRKRRTIPIVAAARRGSTWRCSRTFADRRPRSASRCRCTVRTPPRPARPRPRHDQPCMPNYAWPSYAAYPNYAAVTYPKQYSPTAWPYIGPFYPYPQVPLGWRKVTLEWSDGWWFLDFKDQPASCWKR